MLTGTASKVIIKSFKFAAIGRGDILYNSILQCISEGHECVLIGTSRGSLEYGKKENDFQLLAETIGCPFFVNQSLNQKMHLLENCNAQVAISANWVNIISKNILDIFPHGVLNAHAGDLPSYRGNACANWAIINGEKTMGLCIHQMNEDLDAGDILVKDYLPLNENTYIKDCYKFIESRTPQLYAKVLTDLSNNKAIFHKQSLSNVHRCFPRMPEDSRIIWDQPMDKISRIIRASSDPVSRSIFLHR